MPARLIKYTALVLLIGLIALLVWINLPLTQGLALDSLIPAQAFFCIITDLSTAQIKALVNQARFSPLERLRFMLLPKKVAFCMVPNPNSDKPFKLFFIKDRRLARFFRLFRIKSLAEYRVRILNDVLFVSKQGSPVSYQTLDMDKFKDLNPAGRLENIFFVDNSAAQFSSFLKRIEEKSSYIFLLTLESLEAIFGEVLETDMEILKARIVFDYLPDFNPSSAKRDARFISAILRRFFKTKGLQFNRRVTIQADRLNYEFNLTD